jgi:uncharacterized protein with HEPN domain
MSFMPPEEGGSTFLWDIYHTTKDIHDFVRETTFKEFVSDKKTRFAVKRQMLGVIGEAAKRISKDFKQKHHEIPKY